MHWTFVIAGYVIVFAAIAAYSLWLLARGRSLTDRVPEERRRFLD
jgi:protein-S-isoprenylcysteine O-methyltransferase Ste14